MVSSAFQLLHQNHHHRIATAYLRVIFLVASLISLSVVEGAFFTSNKNVVSLVPRTSRPSRVTMTAESENGEKEGEDGLPIAGSYFNEVPPQTEGNDKAGDGETVESETIASASATFSGDDVEMFEQIIQNTKISRSGGGVGFAKTSSTTDHVSPSVIQTTGTDSSGKQNSFVGIGKPLNDIQNPEYDENGYTLYADETTGEKKRVFEALVEYPSVFKMKIVGKDDENESFAPEIVQIVAKSCGVETSMVKHSKRKNGQWTSVTVHAPVKDADMLYALYENVDKNPRVKFKF
mmetsp:Transcript_11561/g.24727  ORF Transcript_11561/g.24727 Transcript_11561/m.24727 type:complete len:292 (-) Transcript_11561:29-904(-)